MKINAMCPMLVGLMVSGIPVWAQGGHGDPFTPVGKLTVTPTVVQPGVQPKMDWDIEFPKTLSDLALIVPPGQLVLTQTTDVKVRVTGVAFQSGNTDLPVGLWVRVGGSAAAWQMVFYGTERDVQPDEYVVDLKNVPAGTEIDFAGRGRASNGSWYTTRWTIDDDPTVIGLVSGDSVPDYAPAYDQGRIESFMTQFLDQNNRIILGPRDIIHTFELASTTPGDWYFDMQDLVIVTTLGKNNNGHGNNLDGVDVSNPGQGGGGPNGEVDQSGAVDDEGKIKKGRRNRN
jgi:hypothetical protein